MSIFLMFGKYSTEATNQISSDRTEKAREVIQKNGGKIAKLREFYEHFFSGDTFAIIGG